MTTEQNESATPVAKTTADSKPEVKARASRPGPHPLSWINLVLMLGLFALAAYAGWLGWQVQQQTAAELAVVSDRVAQARTEAGHLAAAEGDLLSQTSELRTLATELKAQVDHNTDRLGKLPGAERQDWLLAEVEYLLRMANQRLQLERDWNGALSMLQAADNVLVETRNPKYNPVRALIAKEMLALRAAPAVDYTGAVLRIQALQDQIPQLPWKPTRMQAEAADVEQVSTTVSGTWYENLWTNVSQSLLKLVRIRERDVPMAAPLTPDQEYYLQQNMHLMLEQAQVALLREHADMYQHSLQRVEEWLNEYLMVPDDQTRAVLAALRELQAWDVSPALPDISASLNQLQTLLEQQRRGSVQPKAQNDAPAGGNS
ncbi:uroporphyrinogen-III C-methyltransferase [Thalassolituus sp. LLYu03]|uniref:uroporphyrinogen-III C-methyltransferase n=1 Tax=Thalassolituus sp. LLYu03 TaxID=3421656 RepID=UPI003D2B0627